MQPCERQSLACAASFLAPTANPSVPQSRTARKRCCSTTDQPHQTTCAQAHLTDHALTWSPTLFPRTADVGTRPALTAGLRAETAAPAAVQGDVVRRHAGDVLQQLPAEWGAADQVQRHGRSHSAATRSQPLHGALRMAPGRVHHAAMAHAVWSQPQLLHLEPAPSMRPCLCPPTLLSAPPSTWAPCPPAAASSPTGCRPQCWAAPSSRRARRSRRQGEACRRGVPGVPLRALAPLQPRGGAYGA